MGRQSFSSSLFPSYQQVLKNEENGNGHQPLVNESEERTATYGSGSLNASTMNNESAVLVANGDSESGPDGIHKANGQHALDPESDDECFYSYTWKEYFFSWRFVELLLCVVPFSILFLRFESQMLVPRLRPMPFQTIMNEEDIVWNPVNLEKYHGQTIGHREYQILMGLVPWLLELSLVWILDVRKSGNWDLIHRTTCMFFAGIGVTDSIINFIKYYVGYLRPIFVDVCEPYYDENTSDFQCANQAWNATDARMSFPSNHSGWSFCGMMLLSLYFERKFGLSSLKQTPAKGKKEVLQRRNRHAFYRLVSMMCYFPMLFAFFVAASRVVDNKHFPADVIGGSVLGGAVALLVFGIWFPQQ